MALNYVKFQQLADRLIGENGRSVTLRQSSATPFDVAKPWRGSLDPATEDAPGTEVTAIGVFINQADQDNFGHVETSENGTLLKRGQKRCLVAETELVVLGTDVSRFETLRDNTNAEVWRIVEANILEPGALRIMYDFILEQ